MANKVAGVLSTTVKMDTTEAQKSLKELNNDISSTVSILKQQEQEFKNSGDASSALETKITRLKETQNGYYEKLKLLKQAQNDVKDRLGESSTEYQKYQTQINNTITAISRYDSQISKAEKSLEYYDSGLANLKQSYYEQQRVSQSLVEKLKAEGNTYHAQQEQLKQSKNALSNLQEQYQLQEKELTSIKNKLDGVSDEYSQARTKLNELAQSQGKSSTAYKEQESAMQKLKSAVDSVNSELNNQTVRLNKTATEMANTKAKANSLSEELSKSHPSYLSKVKENLGLANTSTSKLTSSTAKLGSSFKSTALGVGVANTAMMAINAVTNQVGDAVSRVDTLSNSKRVFQNMGYSAKDTNTAMEGLNESIQGLPTGLDEAVSGVQMVASTTNNLKQAQQVWSALNDGIIGFGGSTEQVQTAVQQLSQAFSNGKIDAETWNSMMDAQLGPTLNAIAKDMGITTAQLKDGLSKGTISVQEFQNELIKLDTKGGGGLKSLSKIAHDSTDGIQTSITNMKTAVTRGLGNMITNFSDALGKVTGSNLSQTITSFGKKAETVLSDLGTFLGKIPAKIEPLMPAFQSVASIVKDVLGGAFEALKGIVSPVVDAFKKIGDVKKNEAFNDVCNTLKDVASHHTAIKALGGAIAGVVTAIATAKTLSAIPTVISGIAGGFRALNAAMNANPILAVVSVLAGLASAFITAYNTSESFRKKVNDALKAVGEGFQAFGDVVSTITNTVVKWIKDMINGIKEKFDSFKKMCSNIGDKFGEMGDNLKETANNIKDKVSDKWNDLKDATKDKFNTIKDNAKDKFDTMKSNLTETSNNIKDNVKDKFEDLKEKVKDKVQTMKESNGATFGSMYEDLKSKTSKGLSKIKEKWSDMWSDLKEGAQKSAKNVGNAVVNIVNNVIKSINSMIKKVQKGINWILDKFGASKVSFGTIPEVSKFAKGGTVGEGGTMALVNDAPGSNYREMFATPDGKIGMFPKERNFMTYLPKGTQVLDGERSKTLADMMGIPAFKDGTNDKNIFEKMFDKAWDIAKEVGNVIAHPIKFLENAFAKYVSPDKSDNGWVKSVITKAPGYFAKQGGNWIKKIAEDWKKKKEESSSVAGVDAKNIGAGAKNWTDTIKSVAKAMKVDLSESDINLILWRINKESGGNQSIKQQVWDINMANGNPAQGLLQYVPSTFASYMVSGHNNILSGEDQLYAMFNDSNWRKDIANSGGWGPTGSKRFANGGFVNGLTQAVIGEAGPEVVIPLSSSKQGRALDLLTQTVNKLNRNAGNNTVVTTDNGSLESKLDKMISLLGQLVGINANGFNKQSSADNGLDALYQRMYRDQSINNYQSF